MAARLVALDEGPDIPLDRDIIMVGRHPQCDARLDSLRVSRRHCCCMTQEDGGVTVRDLGSTNGIRINGQRVDSGRVRPGDELSIAHIRFRLDCGQGHEATLADGARDARTDRRPAGLALASVAYGGPELISPPIGLPGEHSLAEAVRERLPSGLADRCRIQVIVQMLDGPDSGTAAVVPGEDSEACRPDLSP